jgi:hypothetical protein
MEGSLGQSKATPQVWFHFSSAAPAGAQEVPIPSTCTSLHFHLIFAAKDRSDISANRKHITARKRFRRNTWCS